MSYFSKFNRKGIPFMEGGKKGELKDYLDKQVHITDYGYINGRDGDFACIQLQEAPGMFFFANTITTEMLRQVDADGMKAELSNAAIVFSMRTAKDSGRDYIAFEFVEE